MLKEKNYSLNGSLPKEEDVINELIDCYSPDSNIEDSIHEVATSNAPIYHSDIWENAKYLKDYINEHIAKAQEEGVAREIDDILIDSYSSYYHNMLNSNLETILYNYAVRAFNSKLSENSLQLDDSDFGYVFGEINLYIEHKSIDRFEKIDNLVDELINHFKDGGELYEQGN